MPRPGAGRAELVLLTIFGVIAHDLARQLFDHLLTPGIVQAVGQLRHRFCNRGDDFIGIDGVRLVS